MIAERCDKKRDYRVIKRNPQTQPRNTNPGYRAFYAFYWE